MYTCSAAERLKFYGRPGKPGQTRQGPGALLPFHLPLVADRQLIAAARAAAGKNLAAVLGRHTLPESVRVATLPLVRLEGAFHGHTPGSRDKTKRGLPQTDNPQDTFS